MGHSSSLRGGLVLLRGRRHSSLGLGRHRRASGGVLAEHSVLMSPASPRGHHRHERGALRLLCVDSVSGEGSSRRSTAPGAPGAMSLGAFSGNSISRPRRIPEGLRRSKPDVVPRTRCCREEAWLGCPCRPLRLVRLGATLSMMHVFSELPSFLLAMMVVIIVYAFFHGRLYLALSGLEFAITKQSQMRGIVHFTRESIVRLGLLMALPMFMEIGLERGFRSTLGDFIITRLQLCSVYILHVDKQVAKVVKNVSDYKWSTVHELSKKFLILMQCKPWVTIIRSRCIRLSPQLGRQSDKHSRSACCKVSIYAEHTPTFCRLAERRRKLSVELTRASCQYAPAGPHR
ncbi:hypothetical protein EJB05_52926, partial [Eragrostis curvula]